MEKFLTGGAGPLFALAGLVVLVVVGVMSILLPILAFRILSHVSKMNDKMSRIMLSLNEAAKAARGAQGQPRPDEFRRETLGSKKSDSADIGEKSFRFK